MTPEQKHQLYGGEISDYTVSRVLTERAYEKPEITTKKLGDIYDTQIKGKQSIDTTGIYTNQSPASTFERDPQSVKMEQQLQQTLRTIAQQLNLNNSTEKDIKDTLSIKQQSTGDIDQANQNVLQALKELKDMHAI